MSSGRRRPAPDAILSHAAYPALDSTHGRRTGVPPAWIVLIGGVSAALHVGKLPPAIPVLQSELGISLVQAGFLLSLVQLAGMMLGLVIGLVADGFGLRRSMATGLGVLFVGGSRRRLGTRPDEPAAAARSRGHGVPARDGPRPWPDAAPGCARPADQDAGVLGGIHAHRHRAGPASSGRWSSWRSAGPGGGGSPPPCRGSSPCGCSGRCHATRLRAGLGLRRAMATSGSCRRSRPRDHGSEPLIFARLRGAVARRHRLPPRPVRRVRLGRGPRRRAHRGRGRGEHLRERRCRVAAQPRLGTSHPDVGRLHGDGRGTPSSRSAPHRGQPGGQVCRCAAVLDPGRARFPAPCSSLAPRLAPSERTISTTVGWLQQWSSIGQVCGPPLVAWVAIRVGGWQLTWVVTVVCCLLGATLAQGIAVNLARREGVTHS